MPFSLTSGLQVGGLVVGTAAGVTLLVLTLNAPVHVDGADSAKDGLTAPQSSPATPTTGTGTRPASTESGLPSGPAAPSTATAPDQATGASRPVSAGFATAITCRDGFSYVVTKDMQRCTHHGGVVSPEQAARNAELP